MSDTVWYIVGAVLIAWGWGGGPAVHAWWLRRRGPDPDVFTNTRAHRTAMARAEDELQLRQQAIRDAETAALVDARRRYEALYDPPTLTPPNP
ncbi:hypothetical protein HY68_36790 [Streptomyces sp. AcH 505]|uniref:hypothetical protein n=1 Tax=Streptomyces sp. AcH 505 TaxID=352211 RepID=UPI000591DF04|nr:hypothetical protein HY68_36790 [Streptomyces sp. AcH 505]